MEKMIPEEIDRALINIKDNLACLYTHQKLSEVLIDKAIDIGKYLHLLDAHQNLSPEQKNRLRPGF